MSATRLAASKSVRPGYVMTWREKLGSLPRVRNKVIGKMWLRDGGRAKPMGFTAPTVLGPKWRALKPDVILFPKAVRIFQDGIPPPVTT